MLITGKGPGQDATINPFQKEDCYAVIENLGMELFSLRIQQNGQRIKITPVTSNKIEKIKLMQGQELYFDSESKKPAKARISYQKISQQ